jgi:hypothetical protein
MKFLPTVLILFFPVCAFAQIQEDLGDESGLYAQTKQINQFLRRFNAEETVDGDRLYPGDQYYQDPTVRKRYIEILFDKSNGGITKGKQNQFITEVVDQKKILLDLHSPNWFAQVEALVDYKGQSKPITLFFKIEADGQGYRWAFSSVHFEPFNKEFKEIVEGHEKPFLHPMSHEIGFMNLRKVIKKDEDLRKYILKDYKPDHLTLLVQAVRDNQLIFKTVTDTHFHFFQVKGWYFKVENLQRASFNSGWLITDLTQLQAGDQETLINYLLKKDN